MSADATADFEALLRRALRPVDPPAGLPERVEATLVSLTELAAEELETWELSAMRDPRNWARPAAAAVVGATAGTALVLIRARRRGQARGAQVGRPLDRTARELAGGARRLLPGGHR